MRLATLRGVCQHSHSDFHQHVMTWRQRLRRHVQYGDLGRDTEGGLFLSLHTPRADFLRAWECKCVLQQNVAVYPHCLKECTSSSAIPLKGALAGHSTTPNFPPLPLFVFQLTGNIPRPLLSLCLGLAGVWGILQESHPSMLITPSSFLVTCFVPSSVGTHQL